jgi:hypothetical protein
MGKLDWIQVQVQLVPPHRDQRARRVLRADGHERAGEWREDGIERGGDAAQ